MSQNTPVTTAEVCLADAPALPIEKTVALPALEKQASARLLDLLNNQGPNGRTPGTREDEGLTAADRNYGMWRSAVGVTPGTFNPPSSAPGWQAPGMSPDDCASKAAALSSTPSISAFAVAPPKPGSVGDASEASTDSVVEFQFAGRARPRGHGSLDRMPGPANGFERPPSLSPGPGECSHRSRSAMVSQPPSLDRVGYSSSAFLQDGVASLSLADRQPSATLFASDRPHGALAAGERDHLPKLAGLERQPSNSPLSLERQPSESILAAVGQALSSPDSSPMVDNHVGMAFKRGAGPAQLGLGDPFKGPAPSPARRGALLPFSTRGPDGTPGFGRGSTLPRKLGEAYPPTSLAPKMVPLQKTTSALPPMSGPAPSASITDIFESATALKRTASLNSLGIHPTTSAMGRQESSPVPLAMLKEISGLSPLEPTPGVLEPRPRPPSTPPGIAPQTVGAGKGGQAVGGGGSQDGAITPADVDAEGVVNTGLPEAMSSPQTTLGLATNPSGSLLSPFASPSALAAHGFGAGSEAGDPPPASTTPVGSPGMLRQGSATPPPHSSPLPGSPSAAPGGGDGPLEVGGTVLVADLMSPFGQVALDEVPPPESASAGLSTAAAPAFEPGTKEWFYELGLPEEAQGHLTGIRGEADTDQKGNLEGMDQGQEARLSSKVGHGDAGKPLEGQNSLHAVGGGKRFGQNASRDNLRGPGLHSGGGSWTEEQLQGIMAGRLNVPPPPPPARGGLYHGGFNGAMGQGRGGALPQDVFHAVAPSLPARNSLPSQMGGMRQRPAGRQQLAPRSSMPTQQGRNARRDELQALASRLPTSDPPAALVYLKATIDRLGLSHQDIELVWKFYQDNVNSVRVEDEIKRLLQHQQLLQRQQQQQQQQATPSLDHQLIQSIRTVQLMRYNLEQQLLQIESSISQLAPFALTGPTGMALMQQRTKLQQELQMCSHREKQFVIMLRSSAEAQAQAQQRAQQQAQNRQIAQVAAFIQQKEAAQQHQQLIEQAYLLQQQQQQQQQQAAATQIALQQRQMMANLGAHEGYAAQLMREREQQQANLQAGAAAAGGMLGPEEIIAAIRNSGLTPPPGQAAGGIPFRPGPARPAPISKFPASDMGPRMAQDPMLPHGNVNAHGGMNGRRSPFWSPDDPQRNAPQQPAPSQTLPSPWAFGNELKPAGNVDVARHPVPPPAPAAGMQGHGLRPAPGEGSVAPQVSVAPGPLFMYQAPAPQADAAVMGQAISRGTSPAPASNAGLHSLWGPVSGAQTGGNVWGAPDSRTNATAPSPAAALGSLDLGAPFKSMDGGFSLGGWGSIGEARTPAAASQHSSGGGGSVPPRDEFDASKFGFFGALPSIGGGEGVELEPGSAKAGQDDDYDAPDWPLENC